MNEVNLGKPLWIWNIIIPSFENSIIIPSFATSIKLQTKESVYQLIINLMFKSSSKFIKASIDDFMLGLVFGANYRF